MFVRVVLAALACLLVVVAALWWSRREPTSAASVWQPAVDVSPAGDYASAPQVTADARGNAIAVWVNAQDGVGSVGIVQSAVRPAGGSWQAPTNISAAGDDGCSPQIAVDALGNAVALWLDSTRSTVVGAVRAVGGAWLAPTKVSRGGGPSSLSVPRVAVDARGNAVAVWSRAKATESVIQAAVGARTGSWQLSVDIAELSTAAGPEVADPQVAVDARGNAVAVWTNVIVGNGTVVQSAVRPAGGAWQERVDLSAAGQRSSAARVAVGAHGDAVAVWVNSGAVDDSVLQGAVRPAGEDWQAPRTLSGSPVGGADIAVDSGGNAIAVWTAFSSVKSAVRPAGGS
jgi:hypothetical protein